jgi:hypothetical protein
MEDRCSRLDRPVARINDLLLGPLPAQARLANHLGEATRQLRVELAARQGRGQIQSWRLCELWLHVFEIWCWAAPMGHLPWQCLCP